MAAADVVLVCAAQESFGRVAVEGMKLGRAVVGPDSGGTAELITDGETGLLYPTGNVEELAARLEALLRDPGQRAALADRGRTWARGTFTEERYVSGLRQVLEEAIAG